MSTLAGRLFEKAHWILLFFLSTSSNISLSHQPGYDVLLVRLLVSGLLVSGLLVSGLLVSGLLVSGLMAPFFCFFRLLFPFARVPARPGSHHHCCEFSLVFVLEGVAPHRFRVLYLDQPGGLQVPE